MQEYYKESYVVYIIYDIPYMINVQTASFVDDTAILTMEANVDEAIEKPLTIV